MITPEEFLNRVNSIVDNNHVLLHSQHWYDAPFDAFNFITDELVFRCAVRFDKDTRGIPLPIVLECDYEDANFANSNDMWMGSTWTMSLFDVMDDHNLTAFDQVTADQYITSFVSHFNKNTEALVTSLINKAKFQLEKYNKLHKASPDAPTVSARLDRQQDNLKRLSQRVKVARTFRLTE